MSHELEFLNVSGYPVGHVVRRNGVTMIKPESMSDDFWYRHEAPKCGKFFGAKVDNRPILYGQQFDQTPKWDENEIMEDGCSGGACKL